jgi:hypothetical protein
MIDQYILLTAYIVLLDICKHHVFLVGVYKNSIVHFMTKANEPPEEIFNKNKKRCPFIMWNDNFGSFLISFFFSSILIEVS